MFCENCGHNNPDGVRFCAKCGTPMSAVPTAPEYAAPAAPEYAAPAAPEYAAPAAPEYAAPVAPTAPVSGAKLRSVLSVAGIGVVVAIILILLFSACGGAKSVANKAIKRASNGKIVAYAKLYHKDYLDENDMLDKKDQKELKKNEEEWAEALEAFEDEEGSKLKFSYKIKDVDTLKGDDLDYIQDEYDDDYDLKVKKAKRYEMEVNAKWDDEEEEFDVDVIVIKIGGKWYLYSCGNPVASLLYEYMD